MKSEHSSEVKTASMTDDITSQPELVIGLVGPIGCDIHSVEKALVRALKQVDYTPHSISLSDAIAQVLREELDETDSLTTLEEKINGGNRVREHYNKNGILAVHALLKIREARAKEHAVRGSEIDTIGAEDTRIKRTAYIVRQLKRPEEVELLQKTYGKQFIQVSITQEKIHRHSSLVQRLGRDSPHLSNEQCKLAATNLINTDENEATNEYGQRITKIFHLADVFINSSDQETIERTTARFINALFGRNNIAPTKDEFGSYFAKAASLRSVDLSRQVGAAIVSQSGDLITIGCNEVPKAGGGNFWDEDLHKSRDIDQGGEANKEETNKIVFDFLRVLSDYNVINAGKSPTELLENTQLKNAISDSLIGGITEYGRMVHAEMNALSDAARLGRTVEGASLFVTTFPCHNCAKHVIAAGISRVIFIEPYPKSRAELFYSEAITSEEETRKKSCDKRVIFSHFSGISPRRYRDIFEKGRRKSKNGQIHEWYNNICSPLLGNHEINHINNELAAIADNMDLK